MLARVSDDRKKVGIELEHKGVTRPDGSELMVGDWSPIVRAKFQLNPLLSVSALVTFRVLSIDPLTIFLKPLNLDPKSPPPTAPISAPKGFSGEIAASADVKDFETLGWACATNALKDEAIDEETFLGDIERVLAQRERILRDRLGKNDWRLLYMVFGETDRVQHMMFRHWDTQHPGYSKEAAERGVTFFGRKMPIKDTIAEIYRQADRIVGEVWRRVNDGKTQLMIVSDHGFAPFRTGVHLNKWLYDHGYLAVKDTKEIAKVKVPDLFKSKLPFPYVDWSNTRAYSLGLGKIYLNIKDREPRGIVDPKDAEALEREIAAALEADVDPDTKKPFVKKAYLARDIYPDRGKNMREGDRDNSEDIVLGFQEGYRVSWESTLGGFTHDVGDVEHLLDKGHFLVPNRQKWSGDHCSVDPSLVTGIFFSTQRFQAPTDAPVPDVRHCAPTILQYFGLAIPAGLRAPLQPVR
jgi:predicted AlkP superfamily phosphohydrolase/phosphomutase